MMISDNHTTRITLHKLELDAILGWSDAERAEKQRIQIDIHIQFAAPPLACLTDKLADTYCYDTLVGAIRETVSAKPFHLLEHLGYAIYQTTKHSVPTARISINVKKQPPIMDLIGGVAFHFGD